jgi:phosphoribosyl 1,2-cyclic phosphodiesterase
MLKPNEPGISMRIRVLGCSGAIAKDCRTTSFLIDEDTLIDAGTGVGDLSLDEMRKIEHVFLTHSHLDHVAALPLMVDTVGATRAATPAYSCTARDDQRPQGAYLQQRHLARLQRDPIKGRSLYPLSRNRHRAILACQSKTH